MTLPSSNGSNNPTKTIAIGSGIISFSMFILSRLAEAFIIHSISEQIIPWMLGVMLLSGGVFMSATTRLIWDSEN